MAPDLITAAEKNTLHAGDLAKRLQFVGRLIHILDRDAEIDGFDPQLREQADMILGGSPRFGRGGGDDADGALNGARERAFLIAS